MRNRLYRTVACAHRRNFAVLAVDGRIDRFGQSNQAELYSRYRPRYSDIIIESILRGVKGRDTYVDWACGSGQLTTKLSPHFATSHGVDKSYEQLKYFSKEGINLIRNSNFDIRSEGLKDGSVDLITVAQAIHWLTPHDLFFDEVQRLLKPKEGSFVIVGYTRPFIANSALNEVWERFYFDVLGSLKKPGSNGCWWDVDRQLVDSKYASMSFPFEVTTEHFSTNLSYSVYDFCKYIQTLSAYQTWTLAHPNSEALHKDVEREFLKMLSCQGLDPSSRLDVQFPYFTISKIMK